MESQILVSFKSRSPEYAIPETPILVPTKLKRFGLSEIINVCLGNQVQIPFDFLIQNQILKSSIEVYLSKSNLSRETTLEIEYIQSILPPTLNKSITHDDWISSIDSKNEYFLTGCYDKLARVLDSRGNILSTLKGHSKPIKSVLFLQQDYCLTGGQDSKILLFNLKNSKIESEFAGSAGIESLKNLDNLKFVAGDSLGKIQLFSHEIQEFSHAKRSSKKLKLDSIIPVQKSIQEFSLHSGIVSGLEYNQKNNQLFSSGHDHSLRVWDLESASNISSMNAQVPFLSLKLSKDSLILSGHSDNIIRMWDSRSNDCISKFHGHSNWVSSVDWSPNIVFHFASASFDGSVKVWDIRSQSYMFNCSSNQEKYLALDWSRDVISAGGQGEKLEFFKSNE